MPLFTKIKNLISNSVSVSGTATITGSLTVDTNTLFVDATNNRVGIGTITPSVALQVVGAISASSTVTTTEVVGAVTNLILRSFSGNNSRITIGSSSISCTTNDGWNTTLDGTGFFPSVTTLSLGKSTNRWSTVWGTNANISTTLTVGTATWNGSTFGGAQTFTNDIVGNGTANRLPNQTATTADAIMTRSLADLRYGNAIFAVKSADTSRSSTTTYADDPHLTLDIPSAGLWEIELSSFTTAADNTGGLKMQLVFSGTFNAARSFFETRTSNQGVQFPAGALTTSMRGGTAGAMTFPVQINAITNRTTANCMFMLLDVTAAGTLKIQWAQNASSATATILVGGSNLKAKYIGA